MSDEMTKDDREFEEWWAAAYSDLGQTLAVFSDHVEIAHSVAKATYRQGQKRLEERLTAQLEAAVSETKALITVKIEELVKALEVGPSGLLIRATRREAGESSQG